MPGRRGSPFKGAICLPKEGEEGVEPIAVTYVRNDLLYTEDHFIDRWTGERADEWPMVGRGRRLARSLLLSRL